MEKIELSQDLLYREVPQNFIDVWNNDLRWKHFCEKHKELFLGVRTVKAGKLQLYYNRGCIVTLTVKNNKIFAKVNHKFWNSELPIPENISPEELELHLVRIKNEAEIKCSKEYKAQQRLFIQNNVENQSSDWYCLDMEYAKSGKDKKPSNGRFDIVAIAKDINANPNVALIELKYGSRSFGGKTSGVYGHMKDFYDFANDLYNQKALEENIRRLMKSYSKLIDWFPKFDYENFKLKPQIYFITVHSDLSQKRNNTKAKMQEYLLKEKKHPKKKNFQKDFVDIDFTDENEKLYVKFLFSEGENYKTITDIVDSSQYDSNSLT